MLALPQDSGDSLYVLLADAYRAGVPVDERWRQPLVGDDHWTPSHLHRLEQAHRRRPDTARTDDELRARRRFHVARKCRSPLLLHGSSPSPPDVTTPRARVAC